MMIFLANVICSRFWWILKYIPKIYNKTVNAFTNFTTKILTLLALLSFFKLNFKKWFTDFDIIMRKKIKWSYRMIINILKMGKIICLQTIIIILTKTCSILLFSAFLSKRNVLFACFFLLRRRFIYVSTSDVQILRDPLVNSYSSVLFQISHKNRGHWCACT